MSGNKLLFFCLGILAYAWVNQSIGEARALGKPYTACLFNLNCKCGM